MNGSRAQQDSIVAAATQDKNYWGQFGGSKGYDSWKAYQQEKIDVEQLEKDVAALETELEASRERTHSAQKAYRDFTGSQYGLMDEPSLEELQELTAKEKELLAAGTAATNEAKEIDKRYNAMHDDLRTRRTAIEMAEMPQDTRELLDDYLEYKDLIGVGANYKKALLEKGFTEDDLKRYAEVWGRVKNQETIQAAQEAGAEFGDQGGVGAWLVSFPAQLLGTATGFGQAMAEQAKIDLGLSGYKAPDANGIGFIPQTFAGAIRDQQSQNILGDDNDSALRKGIGTVGNYVYQGISSALDSGMRLLASGGSPVISSMLASAGSFASTYQDVVYRGGSADQAMNMALASAGLEYITEKFSIDNLLDLDDPKTAKQFIKNMLIQGGVEVSEEEASFLGNLAAEAVFLMDDSSFNQRVWELSMQMSLEDAKKQAYLELGKEALDTAIVSFISGSAMAGAPGVMHGIQSGIETQRNYISNGQDIVAAEGGVDALKQLAYEMHGVAAPAQQKQITKLSDKVTGDTASGKGIFSNAAARVKNANNARKVGKLLHTTIEAVNAQSQTQLAQSMVSHGMKQATAQKLSGIIVKSINGTELTESQVDILESLAKDKRVVAAMKDTFENQESTAYQLGQKVADFEEMVAKENTAQTEDGVQYDIRRTQNMTWDDQINGALRRSGKIARSDTLVLDETPKILTNEGVENRYLAIPLSVVTKAKSGKDASHSITDENIKALQGGVRNAPVVIHNPSRNALVFLTDIKQDGAPVLVAFDKNAVFDQDTVHKATSIHLQMDVVSMLKALPANATIYAKNKDELESAVGVADNLRSLAAQVKFTGDSVTENTPGVNGKDSAKSEAAARKTIAAAVADQQVTDKLMGLYRNGDADAAEISAAFEMGYGGFSPNKLGTEIGGKLTEAARKAYELGKQHRAQEDAKRKGGKAPGGKVSMYYLAKDGKLETFRDGKAGKLTVTGKQSVAVKTADFLHRIGIGGNVYFFESYEQKNAKGETVRVFKDKDGNIKTAPNGIYYSNGDIYIDINAGMDASGITLTTLAHELVHYIQQWSGEKYRALAEFLAEQYEKKDVSAYAAVKAAQKRLTDLRGENVTFAEAYHEWMAESMSTLFNDGKLYDKLLRLKKRDSALYNYLRKFIDRIARLARKHYGTLLAETPEAQFVQGLSMDAIEQLQQKFADALVEAGENHQKAEVQKDTAEVGGGQMQTRNVNGQQVVWIENSGFTSSQLNDPTVIAQYIATHIGDVYRIIESGQKVYIGKDLPGEYTHSKYTSHLQNRNPALLKAKNRAAEAIGEMIEIATNRRWEPTKHKASKDAKYGMYRYDTKYAFPVRDQSGKITDIKAFSAEILIRNASNGKKYLYDIVNIKKDTASAIDLRHKEARKGSYAAASQSGANTNTVSQNASTVNSQNSDRMKPGTDSKERLLSVQQQEYFRESVVVDSEGRLLTMYHGTSRGGFTVFDVYGSNHGLFGMGLYFTDNPDVAQSYTKKGKGTSPQVYEVYLNIKNPMDMDAPADPEAWAKAVPDADFPESGTNEEFYRAMEQYLEDEMYTRWEGAEYAMETISQMGYDGVTHIGGGRVKADGVRHRVYIAFEQEQVKEVSNKQPTDDYDIYRQDRMKQTASGREAFAQVLDSVAADGADRLTIQRYRDAAKAMDEQERKLNEINAQIREITYGSGKQDAVKLRELRLEASKARNRAKLYEDQLAKVEKSQPYQKMMGEIKKTGGNLQQKAGGTPTAGQSSIQQNMGDEERFAVLKEKRITVPTATQGSAHMPELTSLEELQSRAKSRAEKIIRPLAHRLGIINRDMSTPEVETRFLFTASGGLSESLHKQLRYGGSYGDFAKALINLDSILENAVLVEVHGDKYAGTARENPNLEAVYVLFGAFKDGDKIIPVQMEIKKSSDAGGRLYLTVAMTKIEASVLGSASGESQTPSLIPASINYSLADIFRKINPKDAHFLKYVPDGFLTKAQIEAKRAAIHSDSERIAGYRNQPGGEAKRTMNAVGAAAAGFDTLSSMEYEYGNLPEGENAVRDDTLPKSTNGKDKVSLTARSVKGAKVTPDEFVDLLDKDVVEGGMSYMPISNNKTTQEAMNYISTLGWDDALKKWSAAAEKGMLSAKMSAVGALLLNNAAKAGDRDTWRNILHAYQKLGTVAGQTVQAMRILKTLNPDDSFYMINRSVEQMVADMGTGADIHIDPEMEKRYRSAKTDAERNAALDEIAKDVANQIPRTKTEMWTAIRYLNMLGNLRTQVRNVTGNIGMMLTKKFKDTIAAGLETIASAVSGSKFQRTKSATVDSGQLQAAKADFAYVEALVLGGGKYSDATAESSEFARKVQDARKILPKGLEHYRRATNWAMDTGDAIFSRSAYARALAGWLKANGIKETDFSKIDAQVMDNARAYAVKEAQEATFRDYNTLSRWVSQAARGENTPKFIKGVVEGVMPFRKTPANILVRAVEYSHIGFVNSAAKSIKAMQKGTDVTGAEVINSWAKTLTGTGLFALGMLLHSVGMLVGGPDDDEEKDRFESMYGWQNYALVLGDTTITIDFLSPAAIPLFMGAQLQKLAQEDGIELKDFEAALFSVADPLIEMSMLQGVNDTLENIQYAENSMGQLLINAAVSYLTQGLTNTWLGQIERTFEDTRMTTYVDKDSAVPAWLQKQIGKASAKIPGWDYQQVPYINAWGEEEENPELVANAAENMLSPSYISKGIKDSVFRELNRLNDVQAKNVYPSAPSATITYTGTDGAVHKNYAMAADQWVALATKQGQTAKKLVEDMLGSKLYQDLPDAEKGTAITKAYEYARELARQEVLPGYPKDFGAQWMAELEGDIAEGILAHITEGSIKSRFVSGDLSAGEAVDLRVKYSGDTPEEAAEKVAYWDFQEDNPQYAGLDQSAVVHWCSEAKPAGIALDVYYDFMTKKAQCKGVDKNGDGKADSGTKKKEILALIGSIEGLTYKQKKVLKEIANVG